MLTSCDELIQPTSKNIKQILLSEEYVDAQFAAYSEYDYSGNYDGNNNNIETSAYITNGYDFVNVNNISVNQNQLTLEEGYIGQYTGSAYPYPSGTNPQIEWQIIGWEGTNFVKSQQLANKLEFNNLQYLDTLSGSNNLIITYSGFFGNDSIDVNIFPAPSENYFLLNTLANTSSNYKGTHFDNGTIIIPYNKIQNLEKNLYYTIQVLNSKVYKGSVENHLVVFRSGYSIINYFYLSE
jgi:hypothetical protein